MAMSHWYRNVRIRSMCVCFFCLYGLIAKIVFPGGETNFEAISL